MKGLIFLSMSIVLIQPRASIQEKAFTRGDTTGFQTIWCGKRSSTNWELDKTLKKDLEENFLQDSRIQILLSMVHLERNTPSRDSKREVTVSASRSNNSLVKRRFLERPVRN